MKVAGLILIVVGIVMIVFRGFTVPVKEKVVDIGPLEISKTENKHVGWPTYAGGVMAAIGVILIVSAGRKKA